MNNLEFAIAMEKEGEEYYLRQADLNKDNSLYKVCMLMAEDERKHAEILANTLRGEKAELEDRDFYNEIKSIFHEARDVKGDSFDSNSQLEFYLMAQKKEKESIELYLKLREASCEEKDFEIFDFIIEEEREHYKLLGELVELLTHGEEWVESAEFGLRGDY